MEYQHKPTIVDAEQYHGPATLSIEFTPAICQRNPCPLGGDRYQDDQPLPHIDTNHGPVQLEPGWYVVAELDGSNWYPVHPDVFAASYEPANPYLDPDLFRPGDAGDAARDRLLGP